MIAMQYQSTRDANHRVGLSEAIARGLAPDGGLYVPVNLPRLELTAFEGAETLADIVVRGVSASGRRT